MAGSAASLQPGSYRPLTMAIWVALTPDRPGTTPFEPAGSASGLASRISARKSVYFHSSMRRCGRPLASKRRNASSRSAVTAPLPGSLPRAAVKAALSACSAGVFMARTSADIRPPRPGTGHSPWPRARARAPCRRFSRRGQRRLQDRHLQNLIALLLTAGKSDVDGATEHFLADAEMIGGIAHEFHELRRGNFRFAPRLALGVERGAQEGHRSDTRHFHRILERKENTLGRAFIGRHLEDVVPVQQHFAFGHLVVVLSGQHVGERRFARSVRAHDGRDLALL